ncbi:MAG: TIGR04076 family protein [Desulfobacterales bacterium]|nr:TIGR04076 family protein [Desulfobacterales bacterium]
MKFHTCKITVVQKNINNELVNNYMASPENFKICDQVEDNQEFFVENPYIMPAGICPSAWADIRTYIIALASGGSFPFMEKDNSILTSCTDPFRPVIFMIERID